jgi:hypothetical protein
VPDVEEGGGEGEEGGAEDDADGAEDGDASEDGEQDGGGVGAQVGADEDGVEDVVDGADDDCSPDRKEGGFAPVAGEAEVDCYWSPDEEGAEGGDHGAGGEGEGPENDAWNSEDPEGKAGEDALYGGDGEAAERCGEDGVAYSVEEFSALVFLEGKECAKGGESESAVAEEEEEEEEHDHELGDDADRVAEETGEISSEVSGDAAGSVVDVDGAGEVLDAIGERGTVGDETGDLFLMGAVAEGVDCVERLFAQLLGEEERGDDDGENDEDESDGGAEGAVCNSGGQPVIGALGDDREDDGRDDGGDEWLEEQSAEDEDAESEEEESDLLPGCSCAVIRHFAVAPFGLDAGGWLGLELSLHHSAVEGFEAGSFR